MPEWTEEGQMGWDTSQELPHAQPGGKKQQNTSQPILVLADLKVETGVRGCKEGRYEEIPQLKIPYAIYLTHKCRPNILRVETSFVAKCWN